MEVVLGAMSYRSKTDRVLWPLIFIAMCSLIPARTMVRMPDRRRSWRRSPGTPAADVLRGKPLAPWPTGPRAGQPFAVVDETELGRSTCLLLDPTRVAAVVPSSEEDDGEPG